MVLTVLAVLFIEQANASVNLNVLFGFKAIVSNDRGSCTYECVACKTASPANLCGHHGCTGPVIITI